MTMCQMCSKESEVVFYNNGQWFNYCSPECMEKHHEKQHEAARLAEQKQATSGGADGSTRDVSHLPEGRCRGVWLDGF